VVFVGHAVENDIKIVKDHFNLDVDALRVIAATIDTQVLAVEAQIVAPGKKVKLGDLMASAGLVETYLHNGGNDTVCTMIMAFLLNSTHSIENNQSAYNQVKTSLRSRARLMYGSLWVCTTCGSNQHVVAHCDVSVYCNYCANHPTRRAITHLHKSEKCLEVLKPPPAVASATREYRALHQLHRTQTL
jgi:ribosomal protein S27E